MAFKLDTTAIPTQNAVQETKDLKYETEVKWTIDQKRKNQYAGYLRSQRKKWSLCTRGNN